MLKEQKMALAAYSTENDIPQLTTNQLELVYKLIMLLTPVEEIAQSIHDSSASVIIPFVRALQRHLETNDDTEDYETQDITIIKQKVFRSRNYRPIRALTYAL